MSAPSASGPATVSPSRGGRRRAPQLTGVLWLTLVWIALWGDISVANLLAGALLGVAVSLAFPLPRVPVRMRPRPHLVLWALLRFFADVVAASAGVIKVILFSRDLRCAVVQVDLRSSSDLVLTIVGQMTSLVPGSFVVEVRRSSHSLFLHVLDTPTRDAADRARARTLALEERVCKALAIRGSGPEAPPAEGGVL
jgi:multicomponent Na+:H+ antiporter subunit E